MPLPPVPIQTLSRAPAPAPPPPIRPVDRPGVCSCPDASPWDPVRKLAINLADDDHQAFHGPSGLIDPGVPSLPPCSSGSSLTTLVSRAPVYLPPATLSQALWQLGHRPPEYERTTSPLENPLLPQPIQSSLHPPPCPNPYPLSAVMGDMGEAGVRLPSSLDVGTFDGSAAAGRWLARLHWGHPSERPLFGLVADMSIKSPSKAPSPRRRQPLRRPRPTYDNNSRPLCCGRLPCRSWPLRLAWRRPILTRGLSRSSANAGGPPAKP